MFPPAQDAADELADFRVDKGFAAADADDRRPTLLNRGHTLGDGQLVLDGLRILPDATAAGASQVAGV